MSRNLGRRLGLAAFAFLALVWNTSAPADPWSHDPRENTLVADGPRGQCVSAMCPDGNEGAFVIYVDPCSLYTSIPPSFPWITIHAKHVLKDGDFDPAWPAGGITVTATTDNFPTAVTDSAGGFYLAWADLRGLPGGGRHIYMQRITTAGTVSPGWPVDGLPVCTAAGNRGTPKLLAELGGAVIAVWGDRRDSVTNSIDLYAQRVQAGGSVDPSWPVNGRAVYAGPFSQSLQDVVSDGHGGALVVWTDARNGPTLNSDVYAAHLKSTGVMDASFPAAGLVVSATNGAETPAHIVTDGAGGGYVGWEKASNNEIHVTHVLSIGTVDPAWPAGGPTLDPSDPGLNFFFTLSLVADGKGGVVVLWERSGDGYARAYARHLLSNATFDPIWPGAPVSLGNPSSYDLGTFFGVAPVPDGQGGALVPLGSDNTTTNDIVEQHLEADGTISTSWPPNGRAVTASPVRPIDVFLVPGEDGTTILAWSDLRDSASTYLDAYMERVTEDGHLGLAAAAITSVQDVPADQGGHATVRWYPSAYDTLPADPVSQYAIWRELSTTAMAPSTIARARTEAASGGWQKGDVRLRMESTGPTYWEFLASVPSRGTYGYACTIPTRGDSTAAGPARETYEIDTHVTDLDYIITSDPDSGYSVDNLAPPAPANFAGTYESGVVPLVWDPTTAPDLASYKLYRGNTAGFVPGPGNLVASPGTTHYTDSPGAPFYYKLTGIDIHGNEGPAATLLPAGTVGAGDPSLPKVLALARPRPDPASHAATLAFSLPEPGRVQLEAFDVQGRRVRTFVAADLPAGVYQRTWDLRDDAGRQLRGGVYFIRMQAMGKELRARLAVIR